MQQWHDLHWDALPGFRRHGVSPCRVCDLSYGGTSAIARYWPTLSASTSPPTRVLASISACQTRTSWWATTAASTPKAPTASVRRASPGTRRTLGATPPLLERGQTYNDAYSCEIECLGASKRVDINNASLGCESCEEGNVLLRTFSSDGITCSFECRPGYVFDATLGDCVVSRFVVEHALELQLVNYVRYGSSNGDGWRFSIYHSNHSRFAVVVGGAEPSNCPTVRACCWSGQFRVSTLRQLGTTYNETCSNAASLDSQQTGPRSLQFDVPDARLAEVASCELVMLGSEQVKQSLVVSIVDTVRYNTLSDAHHHNKARHGLHPRGGAHVHP